MTRLPDCTVHQEERDDTRTFGKVSLMIRFALGLASGSVSGTEEKSEADMGDTTAGEKKAAWTAAVQ